ncbi:hypothetical protein, partial [Burkholderia multivorans]|uniref:hypothetical protein n=1 Tax=Burkholderia multivorans TaxID=87883 RepID=UPI001C614EB5
FFDLLALIGRHVLPVVVFFASPHFVDVQCGFLNAQQANVFRSPHPAPSLELSAPEACAGLLLLEHNCRVSKVAAPHFAPAAARYFEYGPRMYRSKRAFARGS